MNFGRPYGLAVVALSSAFVAGLAATVPAHATVTTFTSSAAFAAATNGLSVENYSTGVAGETIASGGSFNGLTYTFAAGPFGDLQGGIITNQFASFSPLSLGGNQTPVCFKPGQQPNCQFFFGGDSVTITFATPIHEVGVFFNVNLGSGNYDLNTPAGDATTGSTAFDTSTFVFDGLISTTSFSTVTFTSDPGGSFNIPEVEFGAPEAVPEPSTLALVGLGLLGLGVGRRRLSWRA